MSILNSNNNNYWSRSNGLLTDTASSVSNGTSGSSSTAFPSWLSQIAGSGIINDPNNLSWSEALFGGVTTDGQRIQGIGGGLLGLANSGLNAYTNLGQLNLAQDSLDFQKSAWTKNFENATSAYNTELQDRQQARVNRNSNAQSVSDYMAENGL